MGGVLKETTYIYYLDESECPIGGKKNIVFSALGVPAPTWMDSFSVIKQFRERIKKKYGISPSKELHATKFVNGRGRFSRMVTKYELISAIRNVGFAAER